MGSDILIEIEKVGEDDDDDDAQDANFDDNASNAMTIYSRSSRGKTSFYSKGAQSKFSQTKKKTLTSLGPGGGKSVAMSKQSKGGQSRMSRASMREVKTKQTKQQKSVFTQKEEEFYPETLNVKHFDQLTRIHSMLALINDKCETQVLLTLDAKFFITKMIEATLTNLSEIESSQAPGTESQAPPPGKAGVQEPAVPTEKKVYILPKTLDEWVEFEYPKELIDIISTHEESNLICKFAYEYPELSYYHMEQVFSTLEKYGMHIHCLPI